MNIAKPDLSKFSFSTFWNASRHASGEGILKEISDLGFSQIALDYHLDKPRFEGVRRAVSDTGIKITCIETFCPYPTAQDPVSQGPDCFSLAAVNEQERRMAVVSALETIRSARELEASHVIVHAGYVDVQDMTAPLFDLIRQGKGETSEFEKMRDGMIEERHDFSREHLEAACESFSEITKEAKREKIQLGLRNRLFQREVPNLEEAIVLLKFFRKENLGYWHDTGFAHVQESLGFYHLGAYIEKLHQDLIGTHLHDVLHLAHHCVPGLGEFDFFTFESFLPEGAIKVVQVSPESTPEEIFSGLSQMDKIFK